MNLSDRVPNVSVVMPVYNQEQFIADAVRSILQQSFTDFELIIVDDGSTDRTLEVLEKFVDDRIRIIRKEHTGFIETLVRGYEESRGDWIARMDSDDLCLPDRLRRQMQFLAEHPECGFVGTAYGYVTPNGYCVERPEGFDWRYVSASEITLGGRVFGDPTVVFNRELARKVGFYDPEFNNENPLWYRLLEVSKGAVLGDSLYLIRWLVTSLSRSSTQEFVGAVGKTTAFIQIREKYDPENASQVKADSVYSPEIATTGRLKQGLLIYMSAGDKAAARRLAWNIWRLKPLSFIRTKLFAYALLGILGVRTGEKRTPSGLVACPSPLPGQ